jgi:hypothetical protein
MIISELKRDREKIVGQFKLDKIGEDEVFRTVSGCKIHIPSVYPDAELAIIGEQIKIIGMHVIIVDDLYYALNETLALMEITPSTTTTITIEDKNYLEFEFAPGSVVYKNLNLVQIGTLVYRFYKNLIAMGNVPWYFKKDKDTMSFIFKTALLHGGADLKMNSAALELLAAHMARNPENLAEFFRHYINRAKRESVSPEFISLMNVAYGATNTTAKLAGNMFGDAVTSALVTPSKTTEEIETILRG